MYKYGSPALACMYNHKTAMDEAEQLVKNLLVDVGSLRGIPLLAWRGARWFAGQAQAEKHGLDHESLKVAERWAMKPPKSSLAFCWAELRGDGG